MNKILEVLKINGRFLVFCTASEKEFSGVKNLLISDADGETVKITKFSLGSTRECFIGRPTHPWFGVDEEINERFLRVGNSVAFETEAENPENQVLADSRCNEKTLLEVAEPAVVYAV